MSAELEPAFLVRVWLDGDEYAVSATDIVEGYLRARLDQLLADHTIRAYTLDRVPDDRQKVIP